MESLRITALTVKGSAKTQHPRKQFGLKVDRAAAKHRLKPLEMQYKQPTASCIV